MKNKYFDLLIIIIWVILGIDKVSKEEYPSAFVIICILMFSTGHYFYLKIVEKLNQNKDE